MSEFLSFAEARLSELERSALNQIRERGPAPIGCTQLSGWRGRITEKLADAGFVEVYRDDETGEQMIKALR